MPKLLEQALFRSKGTHALQQISFSATQLVVVVAPWNEIENIATATFSLSNIEYIESLAEEPGELRLPWDIIRFDAEPVKNEHWRFGICTANINIGFVAQWPKIDFR